jgi:hypothetical protein
MARTARRFASRRESSHLPASEAWIHSGGVRNSGSCFDIGLKAYGIRPPVAISERPVVIPSVVKPAKSIACAQARCKPDNRVMR